MRLYPGQKLGQLRVERHLEHDLTSDTYKVVAPEAQEDWALQVFSDQAEADPGRLPTEVQHPNLVRIVQVLRIDGALALLIEYVEGVALQSVLEARPMSLPQVDALADGMLAGLEALHQAGHVHGEIRPGVVLLDLAGHAPVPRLLIPACAAPDAIGVQPSRQRGQSPEALRGQPMDARSDVWSLAALLFEMLAGRPAFIADDREGLREAITSGEVSELPDGLPDRVRLTLARCLRPDADERPADASEMRALWFAGHEAPDGLVSWADRRLEQDDETLSLSAHVPLLRQTYPVVDVLWSRGDAPDVEREPTPRPPRRRRASPRPTPPPSSETPPDPGQSAFDETPDPAPMPAETETQATAPPSPPRASSPPPRGLRLALVAWTVAISCVIIGVATLMCAFGVWGMFTEDRRPERRVVGQPSPAEVRWPDPPALDQASVPEGFVRVQLVAHSDAVRISWQDTEGGAISSGPLRSGDLTIVPTGKLAFAWASVTQRASCIIEVGPETRQLRLDGRAKQCSAY